MKRTKLLIRVLAIGLAISMVGMNILAIDGENTEYSNKIMDTESEAYAEPNLFVDPPVDVSKKIDANILMYRQPIGSYGKEMTVSGGGGGVGQTTMALNVDAATDNEKEILMVEGGYYTTLEAGNEGGVNNGYDSWEDTWIQYDLGKVYDSIKGVNIYRPGYKDNKAYTAKNVKVEFSTEENFTEGTKEVVFGSTDVVVGNDKKQMIIFETPKAARYIRIYQRGHLGGWGGYSNKVRYSEIEVIATIDESEIPKPPTQAESQNLACLKAPYSSGKSLTNPKYISDGDLTNFAIQESTGEQSVQYNFRNQYLLKEIKFKLQDGITYPKVKIEYSNSPTAGFTSIYEELNYTQGNQLTTISLPEAKRIRNIRFTINPGKENKTQISEIEIWGTGASYDESPSQYDGIRDNTLYTEMIWNDEFNDTYIDENKWTIIDGMINYSAIYDRQAVTIQKDGSNSYLSLKSKNFQTKQGLLDAGVEPDLYLNQKHGDNVTWMSGRVETKDKYAVEQGRIAVRAKVNGTRGMWPAIWALSQDEKGHNEIDLLEYPQYSSEQAYVAWATNHFGRYLIDKGSSSNNGYRSYEAWSESFHVYEVEWNEAAMHFYIDGVKVFTTTAGKERDSMHKRPMFIILETQVGGGGWAGNTYANLTDQDSDYLIDWVRVYQKPGYKKAYFDNLDRAVLGESPIIDTEYFISPIQTSPQEDFRYLTNGTKQFEDKDSFFYGGQPRYEESRYTAADGKTGQYLIYNVKALKDVHLSTYYQTLVGTKTSIRNAIQNNHTIDYEFYISPTGKDDTWTKVDNVTIFNNTVDSYPGYARHTYDIYDLPSNTNYLKIVFPDVTGKTYLQNGISVPIKNTDIQLAKVILMQDTTAVQ